MSMFVAFHVLEPLPIILFPDRPSALVSSHIPLDVKQRRHSSSPHSNRRPKSNFGIPRAIVFLGPKSRAIFLMLLVIFEFTGCKRESDLAKEAKITLYGFSVVKEPLEREIFPSYQREWHEKTGQPLNFSPSYAGSEIVTNQIIAGVEADIAILAIERNADRLMRQDVTRNNWRKLPYGG